VGLRAGLDSGHPACSITLTILTATPALRLHYWNLNKIGSVNMKSKAVTR